jgi:hypothetical protein
VVAAKPLNVNRPPVVCTRCIARARSTSLHPPAAQARSLDHTTQLQWSPGQVGGGRHLGQAGALRSRVRQLRQWVPRHGVHPVGSVDGSSTSAPRGSIPSPTNIFDTSARHCWGRCLPDGQNQWSEVPISNMWLIRSLVAVARKVRSQLAPGPCQAPLQLFRPLEMHAERYG